MSDRLYGTLEITLKSDLCSGSGYSFAGIVDSDICYDYCGIPYIPARRLKGCLRETAENILAGEEYKDPENPENKCTLESSIINKIFGKTGENSLDSGRFILGNAYIENHDNIYNYISNRKNQKSDLYLTQNILGLFCNLIANTELEEGVVKENSLRYTRVVNQKSPFEKGKDICFSAEIIFQGDWLTKKVLEDAARGTRLIGLKRNRGFGNVKCELKNIISWNVLQAGKKEEADVLKGKLKENIIKERENVIIPIVMKNTAPLMLSGQMEDESQNYITGQSVLGALARKYLTRSKNNTADDPLFNDLFLNGKVKYTNLYPCDEDLIYYPAPQYINRLKKSKKLVNTIKADALQDATQRFADTWEYNPGSGNQPKKLKGVFTALGDNSAKVLEVKKDIVYHHSHHKKQIDGTEGILYGMEVIRERQSFAGQIIAPKEYEEELMNLLVDGEFRFGKSKNVQYGASKLQHGLIIKPSEVKVKKGQHLVVTFLSDGIFVNNKGQQTVYIDDVREQVKRALDIKETSNHEENQKKYISMMQTTLATGYQGTWNLRKEPVPAIKAGSALVFELDKDYSDSYFLKFIGERNHEGYGQIRLDCAENMDYMMDVNTISEEKQDEGNNIKKSYKVPEELKEVMKLILVQRWLEEKKYKAIVKSKRINVGNSAFGRITAMLRESMDENKNNPDNAWSSFVERINSIKNTNKNEAEKILEIVGKRQNQVSDRGIWELTFGNDLKKPGNEIPETDSLYTIIEEAEKIGIKDEVFKLARSFWGEYLISILIEMKYQGDSKDE